MKHILMHIALVFLTASPLCSWAGTLEVRPQPGVAVITEAVARAAPGDSVIVLSGYYPEHGIVIDRPLSLIGVGAPVIDGRESGQIITVRSDNVRIEGLVVRNVGVSYMEDRAGVKLIDVRDCVVVDNLLINAFFGIYLENSERCVLSGNRLEGQRTRETNSGNGIHLWYCRDITVVNNEISGHRDGIYFEFVENSLIRGNLSRDNLRYGLHFMFSHHDAYENNVFRANGAGVAVMFSDFVTMTDNRFENNWGPASYGVLLKDIRDSRVARNSFDGNTIGLYSEGSIRLSVEGNRFTNNGYAIKMMASSTENEITGNNFIGNTFDVATNSRQNFNSFDGNYWSRYRGYDLDRDGIGDVPHRPVHLFSLLVEREPAGLILLRSFFIDLVDAAERAIPVYTPPTLLDKRPYMNPFSTYKGASP